MRIQLVRSGALVMFLTAGFVPAVYAQDAKAAEVMTKTRKAIGGSKLDALEALSLEAATQRNVGSMQMSSDVELLLELPDKYLKSEATRGGMMNMTMATGFNGDKAIMPAGAAGGAPGGAMIIRMGPSGMMPQDGPKPTPEQLEQANKASLRSSRAELSRMMLGWFGTAHSALQVQYTYVGEAESPDGKAHVIEVKDSEGFSARLFVDQNNSLPLMVTYKGFAPRMMTAGGPMMTTGGARTAQSTAPPAHGGDAKPPTEEERKKALAEMEDRVRKEIAQAPQVEFSLFFDDWKQVEGINFPHLMRRSSGGETIEEWTISKVKVNPKIDAKRFAGDGK